MSFEENKNVKSYSSCSMSSPLGFWLVLELFRGFLLRDILDACERKQYLPTPAWGAIVPLARTALVTEMCYGAGRNALKMAKRCCLPGSCVV